MKVRTSMRMLAICTTLRGSPVYSATLSIMAERSSGESVSPLFSAGQYWFMAKSLTSWRVLFMSCAQVGRELVVIAGDHRHGGQDERVGHVVGGSEFQTFEIQHH